METGSNIVPFKIYLIDDNSVEPEVRRFGQLLNDTTYDSLVHKILEVFPRVSNATFRICWIDEDGDSVTISSDEELIIALTSMKSDLKKLYLKLDSAPQGSPEDENSASHPGVYCDGCDCPIAGFRFKCLKCKNYDLCRSCEKTGIHADHLMLRIPHPLCLDRVQVHKLVEFASSLSSSPLRNGHHKKHHSHDIGHSDSHKKKKRADKRESGAETGDEMDEGLHRKHSHKKCRKQSGCQYGKWGTRGKEEVRRLKNLFCPAGPYTQMMNYFSPIHFQSEYDEVQGRKTQEEPTHMKHLKSIGATIQKLLDPLGVNVEFEVRPNRENNGERKEEEKKQEEKKPEKKQEEKKKPEEKPATLPSPSAPPQKEVRFNSQQMAESMKRGVEEITKILASQTMSSSADNDGWVSYEELKRDSEEPQPSCSGETISEAQKRESVPSAETKTQENSQKSQGTGNLYPDLSNSDLTPQVRKAVEQMLSLGFTNEGNWLIPLLEANGGDIGLALEALCPKKKK